MIEAIIKQNKLGPKLHFQIDLELGSIVIKGKQKQMNNDSRLEVQVKSVVKITRSQLFKTLFFECRYHWHTRRILGNGPGLSPFTKIVLISNDISIRKIRPKNLWLQVTLTALLTSTNRLFLYTIIYST